MILKSFGCSFIFGTDLADDGSGTDSARYSYLTWPSLLAKDLNYEYDCFARPGIGNFRILESILTQSTKNTPAVFVIGWTWIDRFDYTIPATGRFNYRDLVASDVWKTVMPVDNTTVAENYYRDLHSQLRDHKSPSPSNLKNVDIFHMPKKPKGPHFIQNYVQNGII